jgi:hypothetical protein
MMKVIGGEDFLFGGIQRQSLVKNATALSL